MTHISLADYTSSPRHRCRLSCWSISRHPSDQIMLVMLPNDLSPQWRAPRVHHVVPFPSESTSGHVFSRRSEKRNRQTEVRIISRLSRVFKSLSYLSVSMSSPSVYVCLPSPLRHVPACQHFGESNRFLNSPVPQHPTHTLTRFCLIQLRPTRAVF